MSVSSENEPFAILNAAGLGALIERGELALSDSAARPTGITYRFAQVLNGLPVVGGRVIISLETNTRQATIFNSVVQWRRSSHPGVWIDAADAIKIARELVKPTGLRGVVTASQVYLPRDGYPLPCWRVAVPAAEPVNDWEVFIDALDGRIRLVEDRLKRFDGLGRVFDPDPISATGDTTLRDNDDRPDGIPQQAYREARLRDITRNENGLWMLDGPFVSTAATESRRLSRNGQFRFDRSQAGFEEVMAYFHIDRLARFLVKLGLDAVVPHPLVVQVNGISDDISFFSPFTGILTTGTGGVDDAEDADVLIHEYGHAIVNQIIGIWRGGDTDLIAEGWCDFIAGDASLRVAPDFQPTRLYNWDGNGEFWQGRILNSDLNYDQIDSLDPHTAGQIWSSLLTEVRLVCNQPDLWLWVAIDHLFRLGDSATVQDAASALLASDLAVTRGIFRRHIVAACERRRIFPAGVHRPAITHLPLSDSEDLDQPRQVQAIFRGPVPLDSSRLWLIYRFNKAEPDTRRFEYSENEGIFECLLPPPEVESSVDYYLTAFDTTDVFTNLPLNAPLEWLNFYWGPDRIAPTIVRLDSLPNTVFLDGEINITASVEDNIGVSSVFVEWFRGQMQPGGRAFLSPIDGNFHDFAGKLQWDIENESVVLYRLIAADASRAANVITSELHSFQVMRDAVVDNFEGRPTRWILDGWRRDDDEAHDGDWALISKLDSPPEVPQTASARMDERWNFARFGRARLTFWEKHKFTADGGYGAFEVSTDDGHRWNELMRISGDQPWWTQREVSLDDYARQDGVPVVVRFTSRLPIDADVDEGWLIDDVRLSVQNIVSSGFDDNSTLPEFFLFAPWPNPSNGAVTINIGLPASGELRIIDPTGRLIAHWRYPAGQRTVALPLNHLTSNAYFVVLTAGSNQFVVPIMLIK